MHEIDQQLAGERMEIFHFKIIYRWQDSPAAVSLTGTDARTRWNKLTQ